MPEKKASNPNKQDLPEALKSNFWMRVLIYVPMLIGLYLILARLFPFGSNFIGHDYVAAAYHLVLGSDYFWKNGFSIPHYIASQCGGIPYFANPQSIYYSLPQFLAFFIDPMVASKISIIIYYLIGYFSMAYLLSKVFKCGSLISHFCALLFLLNGFSFAHLFAGHLTFNTYNLAPLFMCFLFNNAKKYSILNISGLTLLITHLIYSGDIHIFIFFLFLSFLLFPTLIYHHATRGHLKQFFGTIFIVGLCLILTCSGKLIESSLYSKYFITHNIDRSDDNPLLILLRFFWFIPSQTPLFIRFGNLSYGGWEFIGFISKLTLLTLPVFLIFMVQTKNRAKQACLLFTLIFLGIFLCIALESPINDHLPFFKHYHFPIRALSALIPLIILITAIVLKKLTQSSRFIHLNNNQKLILYFTGCLLIITEFTNSTGYFVNSKLGLMFSYSSIQPYITHAQEAQTLPPVTRITNNSDLQALFQGESSLACYEPIFGYEHEKLNTKLSLDSTSQITEGYYNLTHPGCLLHPEYFHCAPWDKINANDSVNFQKFTHNFTTNWGVPPVIDCLIKFNFFFITFLTIVFIWASCAVLLRPKVSMTNLNPTPKIGKKKLKIGPNDLCACGSGKKYKKCCLK